jgi:hypothetical protein
MKGTVVIDWSDQFIILNPSVQLYEHHIMYKYTHTTSCPSHRLDKWGGVRRESVVEEGRAKQLIMSATRTI